MSNTIKLKELAFQMISVGSKKELYIPLKTKEVVVHVGPLLLLEVYKDLDKLPLDI